MNLSGDKPTVQFLELLTPVQGKIFAFILSRWPNRADAEDIMQDSIVTMWNKFDEYEHGTDFLAWAFTIARFKLLNFRRKKANAPSCFDQQIMDILDKKSDKFIDKYNDRMDALSNCIKKLRTADRKLVELRYLQEQPVTRIAERYDVTSRAIYKTLSKIHGSLAYCVRRSLEAGV